MLSLGLLQQIHLLNWWGVQRFRDRIDVESGSLRLLGPGPRLLLVLILDPREVNCSYETRLNHLEIPTSLGESGDQVLIDGAIRILDHTFLHCQAE